MTKFGSSWLSRGHAPGWLILGAAVAVTVVAIVGEEPCLADQPCPQEPLGFIAFGLFVAVVVAAFIHRGATQVLAAAFVVLYAAAAARELSYAWWVHAAAIGFVALCWLVTLRPRRVVAGLAAEPVMSSAPIRRAAACSTPLQPEWAVAAGVSLLVAVGSGGAYAVLQTPADTSPWLTATGLGAGLAVALGWRSADYRWAYRTFLSRPQPRRRCVVVPLRFEILVLSPREDDPVLLVPTTVWEERLLAAMWSSAGPDGCDAWLHGDPEPGRWCAVEVGNELVVANSPARTGVRNTELREAVTLLRHLQPGIDDDEAAARINRTAERYAATVGEDLDDYPAEPEMSAEEVDEFFTQAYSRLEGSELTELAALPAVARLFKQMSADFADLRDSGHDLDSAAVADLLAREHSRLVTAVNELAPLGPHTARRAGDESLDAEIVLGEIDHTADLLRLAAAASGDSELAASYRELYSTVANRVSESEQARRTTRGRSWPFW